MSVLEADNRRICGFSSIMPDSRFPGTHVFDLFLHPAHVARGVEVAEHCGIRDFSGKVQSYATAEDHAKIEALRALGFSEEARFAKQIKLDDGTADLLVLSRS